MLYRHRTFFSYFKGIIHSQEKLPFMAHLVAGSSAGIITKTALAPLERLKILA
jgi:hypothetical protein